MRDLVFAVDVGTASTRAGIFDRAGGMLARAEHRIEMFRPDGDRAEYDSEEIWRAVCAAVRDALGAARVEPDRIAGIGFDATCSLVVRGRNGEQVSVSSAGDSCRDTIAWLDHRTVTEAEECTATGHPVLDFIGGVMSPEMQMPRLMWLKRHAGQAWAGAGHVFDLADYLAWRATGSDARSRCTLTAKWCYLPHRGGWQRDYLDAVGIGDSLERGLLGDTVLSAGSSLGPLTPQAAGELGLDTGCMVGAGLIDAFAGGLGVVGGYAGNGIDRRAALVAGTSSCAMCYAPERRHVHGVWGPYPDVTLEGYWLTEAGQSATGALLDLVIRMSPAGGEPDFATHRRIHQRIAELRRLEDANPGGGIHVLPDFHGNRSPLADPRARGVISGLGLDPSFDGLCRLYWRVSVALALSLRQILEHLNANGYSIETLHVTGGQGRSPLLVELYADATGFAVCDTDTEDAVLLGTAMVAATASGWHNELAGACRAMRRKAMKREPSEELRPDFDRDYRVFLKMQEQRRELVSMLD